MFLNGEQYKLYRYSLFDRKIIFVQRNAGFVNTCVDSYIACDKNDNKKSTTRNNLPVYQTTAITKEYCLKYIFRQLPHPDASTQKRGCPYSTAVPFSTITSTIFPFVSALTSFIIFMASTMQTTVSSPTSSPTLT